MIIHPPRYSEVRTPASLDIYYEDVDFKSSDGLELKGWFIPAQSGKKTIILCHGYGTNKSDLLDFGAFFMTNNFNAFLFDFRGHGDSEGKCSLGFFEGRDLEGAVDWLKTQKSQTAIGAFGVSMGATTIFMAAEKILEIKAVAGDSGFSSFKGIIARFARLFYHLPRFPFACLIVKFCEMKLKFKAKDFEITGYIGKISPRPILIIHGKEDKRICFSEAEFIYEAAEEPREIWVVPGAGHLEAYNRRPQEYERKILEFFRKYV